MRIPARTGTHLGALPVGHSGLLGVLNLDLRGSTVVTTIRLSTWVTICVALARRRSTYHLGPRGARRARSRALVRRARTLSLGLRLGDLVDALLGNLVHLVEGLAALEGGPQQSQERPGRDGRGAEDGPSFRSSCRGRNRRSLLLRGEDDGLNGGVPLGALKETVRVIGEVASSSCTCSNPGFSSGPPE